MLYTFKFPWKDKDGKETPKIVSWEKFLKPITLKYCQKKNTTKWRRYVFEEKHN